MHFDKTSFLRKEDETVKKMYTIFEFQIHLKINFFLINVKQFHLRTSLTDILVDFSTSSITKEKKKEMPMVNTEIMDQNIYTKYCSLKYVFPQKIFAIIICQLTEINSGLRKKKKKKKATKINQMESHQSI